MKYEFRDFQYHLLSAGNIYQRDELPLRNKAYQAWYKLWDQVYKEAGSEFSVSSDEFIRQDIVCVILLKGEVAGVHLYSFFDLDSQADCATKYFKFFSQNYLDTLKSRNVKTLMSMEYLTVPTAFRKSIVGVPLGSTLLQLGTHVFAECDTDCIVAPARNDVKVNEMCYDVGFSCIEKNTVQRNFICDLIACYKGDEKLSDNPLVRELCQYLWQSKTIHPSAAWFMSQAKQQTPAILRVA